LSSVRVFFPRFSLEDAVVEVKKVAFALSKQLALRKVALFGSYTKNRQTVGSDIDLFIVFDDLKCAEASVYKTLMENIRLPRVELHILSEKDYILMKNSKWIREIEAEGIGIL